MNPTRPRRRRGRPRGSSHKGTCSTTGKARFGDAGDAYAAAVRLSRKIGPLRAYLCPACSGWHLTRRRVWKDRA